MLNLSTLTDVHLQALAAWVSDLLVQREKHGCFIKRRRHRRGRPSCVLRAVADRCFVPAAVRGGAGGCRLETLVMAIRDGARFFPKNTRRTWRAPGIVSRPRLAFPVVFVGVTSHDGSRAPRWCLVRTLVDAAGRTNRQADGPLLSTVGRSKQAAPLSHDCPTQPRVPRILAHWPYFGRHREVPLFERFGRNSRDRAIRA